MAHRASNLRGHGMSGIMINEKAETNLPGLYAAGDAACVPKQFLTGAFVFGQIAAESALAFMEAQPRPKADSILPYSKRKN